ncbi:hypothetical protein [Nocardiopsis sp. CC223A]|uniref:hypothetical protein n=1 Tax=Nocardiopsis sp. CC223A TaxID=3044051 RepID=UPI00278BC4D6|nr:hypothetical protein [Nocardiopsis sp. CC223A]
MPGRSGGPRDFWEREQGGALRSVSPVPTRTASPAAPAGHARPPAGPAPTGPPARVGGTVAALVVAALTLIPPLLGAYLGVWFLLLGANVPGIALAVVALTKVPDAPEVERYLRYTWACNLAYGLLGVPVMIIVLFVFVMALMLGY